MYESFLLQTGKGKHVDNNNYGRKKETKKLKDKNIRQSFVSCTFFLF